MPFLILYMDEGVMNKLIGDKRLDLNSIWNSKVNQGDVNVPKRFDDMASNMAMCKHLFDGICKLALRINEQFEQIFTADESDTSSEHCYNVMLWTNALLYRLNIFKEVKIKQFKLNEHMLVSIKTLVVYYLLINGQCSGSRRISEYYSILNEFIQQSE
jgi:hypothetical protein